jgi:uncharacterized protein YaaW (UPF0174 family)
MDKFLQQHAREIVTPVMAEFTKQVGEGPAGNLTPPQQVVFYMSTLGEIVAGFIAKMMVLSTPEQVLESAIPTVLSRAMEIIAGVEALEAATKTGGIPLSGNVKEDPQGGYEDVDGRRLFVVPGSKAIN